MSHLSLVLYGINLHLCVLKSSNCVDPNGLFLKNEILLKKHTHANEFYFDYINLLQEWVFQKVSKLNKPREQMQFELFEKLA